MVADRTVQGMWRIVAGESMMLSIEVEESIAQPSAPRGHRKASETRSLIEVSVPLMRSEVIDPDAGLTPTVASPDRRTRSPGAMGPPYRAEG